MQEITLFIDGERTLVQIPPDTTVGQLPGLFGNLGKTAAVRVNGNTALTTQKLNAGDRVTAVPQGGQLA